MSAHATTPRGAADGQRYLERNEDRLAWIMGSSRSGSTWVLRMVTEDARVVGIDDPHLGHHLGVWRPLPLAWSTAADRPELRTLGDVKRDKPGYFFSERHRDVWLPALRDLIRARFGAQLAEEAASVARPTLVVKEPGSQSAGLLLDAFPSSRLIFLLRDGRDVVDSWLDAYRSGSWAIEEGAFPVAPEGRASLVAWLSSVWAYRTRAVAAAYARHDRDKRLLVRYEDLLREPAVELRRIFDALGIRIDIRALRRIASKHDYELVSPERRGSRQEVRNAQPGGWRKHLTADEQRLMHGLMGRELETCGYLDRSGSARAA